MADVEAVILGGGPAGLAAAIALRQRGIGCLVVEALEPPFDKACGEGLMPDAVLALNDLGVEVPEGHAFRGIRFSNATHSVEACFPAGAGLGIRRTALHRRMVERAQELGAVLAWGSRAMLYSGSSLLLNGSKVEFRWLIGADGAASGVRRWARLEEGRTWSRRVGFRQHYGIAPWSDRVEVHWGPGRQAYVTPVASNQVCVVLASRERAADRENLLEGFPQLSGRLQGAPVASRQRGAVTGTRTLGRVWRERVALIGDASGTVDSTTGDGLAMAFRQALALAASLEQGGLEEYGRRHRAIRRLPGAISLLLLAMDRWERVEGGAMRALAAHPELFAELVAIHAGGGSLARFALRHGALLGWKLLAEPAGI